MNAPEYIDAIALREYLEEHIALTQRIDLVPVVRCKDCIHASVQHQWPGADKRQDVLICNTRREVFSPLFCVAADGYCQSGKKKESGE